MKLTYRVVIIFAVTFLCSCKKSYTCSCTNTIYANGGTILRQTTTGKAYSAKMTKKQADAACAHEKVSINDNTTDQLGGDPNVTSTVDCSVK